MIVLILDDNNKINLDPAFKTWIPEIQQRLKDHFKLKFFPSFVDILYSEFPTLAGELISSIDESTFKNNKDSTLKTYYVYWRKALKIYNYGSGPKISSTKFYGILYFISSMSLVDQFDALKSYYKYRNENDPVGPPNQKYFQRDQVEIVKKSEGNCPNNSQSWQLLCLESGKTSVEPTPETIIKEDYLFYFMPLHVKYSDATLPIVKHCVTLPPFLSDVPEAEMIKNLDKQSDIQQNFEYRVLAFTKMARKNNTQRWNSTILTFYNYLYSIQPLFKPASTFHESTRRMIIDPVVMCAAAVCNHTVVAEKSIWNQKQREPFSNVVGYGPLDLVDEGTVPSETVAFNNKTMVSCQFEPPPVVVAAAGPVAKKLRTTAVASKGPPGESVVPPAMSGSFDFKVLPSFNAAHFKHVLKCCSNIDLGEIESAADAAMEDMDLDDDPNEFRNNIIEAKIAFAVASLCQLLLQMHDSLLKPPGKDDSSSSSNMADKDGTYRYGVLTSGQTYLFFGLDWSDSDDKPTMEYFGRLYLPTLIYINNANRFTGAEREDNGGYKRLCYTDFERVVAALAMMMTDKLREKEK